MNIKSLKINYSTILGGLIAVLFFFMYRARKSPINAEKKDNHKRIVNIINFVRLCEPRVEEITEKVCTKQ